MIAATSSLTIDTSIVSHAAPARPDARQLLSTAGTAASTATHAQVCAVEPAAATTTPTTSSLTTTCRTHTAARRLQTSMAAATRACSRVVHVIAQRVSGFIDGVTAAARRALMTPRQHTQQASQQQQQQQQQHTIVIVDVTSRLQQLHTQLSDNLAAEAAALDAADIDAAAAASTSVSTSAAVTELQRERLCIRMAARRLVAQLGSTHCLPASGSNNSAWPMRASELQRLGQHHHGATSTACSVGNAAAPLCNNESTLVPVVTAADVGAAALTALCVSALLSRAPPAATSGCDAMASWLSTASPAAMACGPLAAVAGWHVSQYGHSSYDGVKTQYHVLL
jgi:hypothetical protein